ncbi:MAG: hypothetical protein GY799_04590 [Desulfobulbaceae bacterium]|nr:hypothetical protein [Desulfobulbaceae bacterium]
MTMGRIAIFHTGFHKTGSSSIQHSLAHNRSLLKAYGYHYPDICLKGKRFYNCSVPLYGRYCDKPETFKHYWYHNELDADFANGEIDKLFERELWREDKLIFSDEFISRLAPTELAYLRDDFKAHGYKVRVISYVREPFNLLVSSVQQRTRKQAIQRSLENSSILDDYCQKMQKLIDLFQSDAEFYSFENACQHAAGPVGFFFDLIGIDLPVEKALRINEGMSAQATRLLSFVNDAAPMFVGERAVNPLRKKFDYLPLEKISGERFQLTVSELEQVKLDVLHARAAIAGKLGDDFLPPVDFSFCDSVDWGSRQLEYLLKISDSLDLQMLLRVHDYLASVEIKEESVCAQRDRLSMLIRKRLDKEKVLGCRGVGLKKLAMRLRIYELAKWARSLILPRH